MRRSYRKTFSVLSAAFLGIVCSGCGGNLYEAVPVTGTVMCNGKPAVGGYVIFEPIDDPDKTGRPAGESGRMSRGMVNEDGSFTLVMDPRGTDEGIEGALIGPHRIVFIAPNTEPVEMDPADLALSQEEQERIKAEIAKIPVFKPLECGPQGITPAEVEVKPDDNSFEFTLKPGGGQAPRRRQEPLGSS